MIVRTKVFIEMIVTVDSKLRIALEDLPRKVERELCEEFTHGNPKHFKLARMNRFWAAKEPASIEMYNITDDELQLPRGGAARLRSILNDNGLKPHWVDERTSGNPDAAGWCPPHMPAGSANPGSQIWDHQREMRDVCIKRENTIARAPTGSGKTTAAISILPVLQLPTIVIVYDGGLLQQWRDRLVKELGIDPKDIGQIGAGKFKIKPITIAMQQTLVKMKAPKWRQVNEYFGVVICDEVQRFAAATFIKVIDKFSAKYRIGISADETRKDEKEFLIYDEFGPCSIDIPLQELIDKGLVHDVKIRVHPTEFKAEWYVKARKSKKKLNSWKEDTPDFNKLLEEIMNDADRNELAMQIARTEMAEGHQCIMFSHRREHCIAFTQLAAEEGHAVGLMLGGKPDAVEFNRSIDRLRTREISFGAGTIMAVGQGLDIPSVSRGIATTNMTSNRQGFGQLRGRLCRIAEGKDDAVLHVLWDQHIYGIGAIKNLIKWNNQVEVWHEGKYVPANEFVKLKKGTENAKTFSPKEKQRIDAIFKSAKRA